MPVQQDDQATFVLWPFFLQVGGKVSGTPSMTGGTHRQEATMARVLPRELARTVLSSWGFTGADDKEGLHRDADFLEEEKHPQIRGDRHRLGRYR